VILATHPENLSERQFKQHARLGRSDFESMAAQISTLVPRLSPHVDRCVVSGQIRRIEIWQIDPFIVGLKPPTMVSVIKIKLRHVLFPDMSN
jgi:hypothetical protein